MAVDFFLKLDGMTGESTNVSFKNQIQLSSYSFAGTNKSSVSYGGGSGSGKVSLGPLVVVKQPDSATTALFVAMCSGEHIANGLLSVVKAGASNHAYIVVKMTSIFISGFETGASTETPTEQITLSYASIQYTYFAQNSTGTLVASGVSGWNLLQNKKI